MSIVFPPRNYDSVNLHHLRVFGLGMLLNTSLISAIIEKQLFSCTFTTSSPAVVEGRISQKSSPSAAGNRETEGDKRGTKKIYSALGSAVYADYCAGNAAGHGAGVDIYSMP